MSLECFGHRRWKKSCLVSCQHKQGNLAQFDCDVKQYTFHFDCLGQRQALTSVDMTILLEESNRVHTGVGPRDVESYSVTMQRIQTSF